MKIGLIDVDGHHFPNLALMRISAYHKAKGDTVEWWWSDFIHYDIVYMSKIFSDAYSPDVPEPMNADRVIKGGTGYCITLGADGKEHFDQSKNTPLPPEMERCFPDYSIYPQFNFTVSMTSRGCPRGCSFCHVAAKEGKCARKVANVSDFWNGQPEIRILDPNITACREKRDLMRQYRETGAILDFTQGLDIRLLDEADLADINQMRLRTLHFAWDNPKEVLHMPYKVASGAAYLDDMRRQIAEGGCDYTVNGACSGCGECCSNLLPMTRREIDAIRKYVKSHGIKPRKHFIPARNPVLDGICPFRDNANRRFTIYEARPAICRVYRCDKAAHGDFFGEMPGEFSDYGLVNVRETFFGEGG